MYFVLLLGRFLDANISLPRPCDCLTSRHAPELPCSVGWDRYFDSAVPIGSAASTGLIAAANSDPDAANPCDGREPLEYLLERSPNEIPVSFCLRAGGKRDVYRLMRRLAAGP